MKYRVVKLKDSLRVCSCGNQAKYKFMNPIDWETIRFLCGACNSVWESALVVNGYCSDNDCLKCNRNENNKTV